MSDEASATTAVTQAAAPEAIASAAPAEAKKGEELAAEAPSADAPAEKPTEESATAESENSIKAPTEKRDSAEPAGRVDPETTDTSSAPEASKPSESMNEEGSSHATFQADAPVATPKPKDRRKSAVAAASTGKKLNKKVSKPNLLHLNAQPGDHFFVKLKGHPKWPVIICDDDMLPRSLLGTRPVTAKRADGTYRDDFADGGKRAHQRTFPVMYLYTNEFGWVNNADLSELDPDDCTAEKAEKLKRKDLAQAYELAAQNNPLSYYKGLLAEYQAEILKAEEDKAAALLAKQKQKDEFDADGDVEMADVAEEGAEPKPKKTKTNKRKAEDSAETPARSGSVKKPKIKLLSTPKTTNGASATPKAKTSGEAKSAKSKPKKAKVAEKEEAEKEKTPKEPELSLEEKLHRKEKEVLWLRHRLQKGLITRDSEPKEEEMKGMAEYISKLETFPDLEPSIIRATKIHKVLKAILKLERIPKEEEFNFKSRSQVLWDKWTKILTADSASTSGAADDGAAAPANEEEKETAVNDVNGEKAAVAEEAAEEGEQGDKGVEKADGGKTNGVKEHVEEGDVAAPAEKKSEDADGEPSTQKVKTEIEA